LGELTSELSHAQPGNVYFAHLLLPHYPYAYDANCRLLRWRNWEKPFAGRQLSNRQHAYYAQVRCTMSKVRELLAALDRSPASRDNIVIIHGDHGSRITEVEPADSSIGKFSDSDMVATYSTLFAVRPVQRSPSYRSQRLPIAQLLKDFARAGFARPPSPPSPAVPTVHLDGPGQKPGRRAALPTSWAR
jgi:arylsulfatase A-like enzyme